MKSAKELHQILTNRFSDDLVELHPEQEDAAWFSVKPDAIQDISKFLRDEPGLAFDSLMCLSGVHYPKEEQFVLVYHLHSTSEKHKITLKVILPQEKAHAPTVEQIWKTADWHEREAFDMFGIQFDGHPDLRRILCPDDWEGFPLRKDYKTQEFYRGMKVAY